MICPKCFKEFENFNYEEETYEKGMVEFLPETDEFDFFPNANSKHRYFKCPECDEVLFNDYDEARKFAMIQKRAQ